MSHIKNRMAGLALAFLAAAALLCGSGLPTPELPVGTQVSVTLISTLSSAADRAGDMFTAQIQDPIFAKGVEVVPAGSTLRGHVTFIKPPGRVKGKAEMRLVADAIVLNDGQQFNFSGQLSDGNDPSVKVNGNEGTIEGKGKSKTQAAKEAGIGAAAGAGVGALSAGGTGALYGAGIGAVAGLIHTLAQHHKDVVLKPGTPLMFVLTSPGKMATANESKGTPVPFVCQSCD